MSISFTFDAGAFVLRDGSIGTGYACCCASGCCCIEGVPDPSKPGRAECEAAGGVWSLPVSQCYVNGEVSGDYTTQEQCEYCEPIPLSFSCTETTPTGSLDFERFCDSALVDPEESCPDGYTDNGLVTVPGVGEFRSCLFCFPCPEGTEPYVSENGQNRCGRAANCPPGFVDAQNGNCVRSYVVADCVDCPGSCSPTGEQQYSGPCGTWVTNCPPCETVICCCINGALDPTKTTYESCRSAGGIVRGLGPCAGINCNPGPCGPGIPLYYRCCRTEEPPTYEDEFVIYWRCRFTSNPSTCDGYSVPCEICTANSDDLRKTNCFQFKNPLP